MKNKMKLVIVAAALCAFAMSCGNSGKGGKVLFESDDKKIKVYENEVNLELEKSLFSSGVSQKDLTPDQIAQMKKNIIQNIALNRALVLKAKEQKLDQDKKYTESEDILKEQSLASLAIVNDLNEKVKVSDSDAKAAYDANAAKFQRAEDTVKLQLIVFRASDKAKAEAALKEVMANPANFTSFVQKYNGNSGTGTGETQEIPMSQLAKSFEPISKAVQSVSNGQVVNSVIPVGANELYIVKVLQKNPKGQIPFETVKEDIKTQIGTQKRQMEQQNFMKSVADEFKLTNIADKIKDVK